MTTLFNSIRKNTEAVTAVDLLLLIGMLVIGSAPLMVMR